MRHNTFSEFEHEVRTNGDQLFGGNSHAMFITVVFKESPTRISTIEIHRFFLDDIVT